MSIHEDRAKVINWLNIWPSRIQGDLLDMAKSYGYPRGSVGDFISALILGKIVPVTAAAPKLPYPEQRLGIHELALEMVESGYLGQMMDDEERAKDYIYMAAHNPDVEDELPPRGFSFWRAAPVAFKRWKARRHFEGIKEG